nr:ribonuclease H-like domain-containing protein [Tanacetum cinerariifolium]
KRLVDLNPTTAKDAWTCIAGIFQDNKRPHAIALKSKLRNLKLEDLSIDGCFQKLESIFLVFNGLGSPLSNDDGVTFTLEGLPSTYETISTIIVSRVQNPLVDGTSASPMVLLAKSNTRARRGPSLEKVNNPCWSFAKGSCRFGDACKYLHNGVHSKFTLLPHTSSSALSVPDVTHSDLDMLQSLLAKFGLNAPNTSTPSPSVAYMVSVPPGFPSVLAQLSAQPTYVSPQLLPSSFRGGGPIWEWLGYSYRGFSIRRGHYSRGSIIHSRGFRRFLVHRRGFTLYLDLHSRQFSLRQGFNRSKELFASGSQGSGQLFHVPIASVPVSMFQLPEARSWSYWTEALNMTREAPVHTPQVDVPTPPTPPTPLPPPMPQSVPQIVPEHAPAPTNDSPTLSIHPMVTCSRIGTTRPNPLYAGHVSTISPLPRSYKEAFNDPNWQNAMFDEYNALIKNKTWTRARLIANGSTQVEGVDVDETFSPVVKPCTIQTRKYAMEILERAHIVGCNPSQTPVDTESKLGDGGTPVVDPTLYLSLAGSLQYLTFTRPDITYVVQQVCLYMHDPREPHFSALKQILRYVQGTLDYGLQLFSSTTDSLIAYSDANWAGCTTARRSTLGYCVFLGNNIRNLLHELHTPLSSATIVYCDNVSVVYLSSNPVQHQRTKHIEIDIHFVRALVATGQVRVLHAPSRFQDSKVQILKSEVVYNNSATSLVATCFARGPSRFIPDIIKTWPLGTLEDDPDVIHVDNSSDLALSTSLNDLEITALHIDGQSIDVDAPPHIIDVIDEDDDIIDKEDLIPHDLADSNVEDLVNLDIDYDVAWGHGDDGGDYDHPPPYQIPTGCEGCLGNREGKAGVVEKIGMESSATREYLSLIHTFFLIHNVGGVFLNSADKALYDEMLRLQGLGSNTPSDEPYTEDEIMAIVRGGKQQGHILGIGRVLPGQGTVIPPPPPCMHSSDVLESQPEYDGGSESGGCGDDELGDDEDGGDDGEDEDDRKPSTVTLNYLSETMWVRRCRPRTKIIEARYYSIDNLSFSARDYIRHGTHAASIAAGNCVKGASYYGIAELKELLTDGVDVLSVLVVFDDAIDVAEDPIAIGSFMRASDIDRKILNKVLLGKEAIIMGQGVNAFPYSYREPPLAYGKEETSTCSKTDARTVFHNALRVALLSKRDPKVQIFKSEAVYNSAAPLVAMFSARGPSRFMPYLIKPDVTTPGVEILVAFLPKACRDLTI